MATIAINDITPAGLDLLSGSESYMMDLSEDELGLQGGIAWTTVTVSSKPCVSAGVAIVTFAASYIWGRH